MERGVLWSSCMQATTRTSRTIGAAIVLAASGLAILCPACGGASGTNAPAQSAEARIAADAPRGVCRIGSQFVEHFGCIDEELAFSEDALASCRAAGEAKCGELCARSDYASCTSLGVMHHLSLDVSPDEAVAARYFGGGCKGGDGAACADLGLMYAKGLGLPVDVAKAETYYAIGCDLGNVASCTSLASARTVDRDPPPALAHATAVVERACEGTSDVHACAVLGTMYASGSGVARDEAKAAELYERACKAGVASACVKLGHAFLVGEGVHPDDVRALEMFRKGCDRARSDSCTELAVMYCIGRGVPRDAARSSALFQQACDAGDPVACRARKCDPASAAFM
jgi:TPR repeat protein